MVHLRPQPWWQRRPADFYRSTSATELGAHHRLTAHAIAGIDRVLRTGLSVVMSAIGGGAIWRAKPRRARPRVTILRSAVRAGTDAFMLCF